MDKDLKSLILLTERSKLSLQRALGQLTETNTLGAHGVTLEVAVLWLIVGSSKTDVFQNLRSDTPHRHTDLHSAVSTNVATRHDLKALHGKHSSILGTCI